MTRLLKDLDYIHIPSINQTQNGKKEYDGNPIFSAFISGIEIALRIIQVSPKEEGDDISAWIDDIELKENIKNKELVLDLKLFKSSKNIAEKLIHK